MRRIILGVVVSLAIHPALAARKPPREDTRPAHSFSSSPCKSESCFKKHPDGYYYHPNASGARKAKD